MKVIISGAGIGGLALAQGLHRAGHDVVVFERGASSTPGTRRRDGVDVDTAGVGHGTPLASGTSAALAVATDPRA